mmetsp:Transcript_12660/g.31589  ORF Transcript_12660/g.31589 Transcript_12660/m.31589 type:complete len:219 (+) Transcript_12660:1805-2461(+)
MRPVGSRRADLAVSSMNAVTESSLFFVLRECAGQQPLMPEEALAELPPIRRSLSTRATRAPLSRSRSVVVSPATPEPITATSKAVEAGAAVAEARGAAVIWRTGCCSAACKCRARVGNPRKWCASSVTRASPCSTRRTASISCSADSSPFLLKAAICAMTPSSMPTSYGASPTSKFPSFDGTRGGREGADGLGGAGGVAEGPTRCVFAISGEKSLYCI